MIDPCAPDAGRRTPWTTPRAGASRFIFRWNRSRGGGVPGRASVPACTCLRWGLAAIAVVVTMSGCASLRSPSTRGVSDAHSRSGRARPGDSAPAYPSRTSPQEDDTDESPVTVMFVNGESIDAEEIVAPLRTLLEERAAALPSDQYRREAVDLLGNQIRAEARNRLLYQEASKGMVQQEWDKIEEFVDARIRDIVNAEHAGRQTRYEKALARQGRSIQDDRDRIRRELVVQRYLYQTVGQRVTEPTRRELWQYFEENKDAMSKPPRRELFLIEVTKAAPLEVFVNTDGSTESLTAAEAIERAQAALDAGHDFGEVARTYSTGLHADEGGAWGFVGRDSMRDRWQPVVNALFELAAGQYSDAIEIEDAFFIVKCGAIDPGEGPDFEAWQPELIRRYRDHQFNLLVDELVHGLQERATIQPANLSRFLRGVLETAPKPARP
jgi:parvulin-like peptidyl-prolyl isomerase